MQELRQRYLRQRPVRAAPRTFAKLTALVAATALLVAPVAARAQENRGPPILRDAEIEQLRTTLARLEANLSSEPADAAVLDPG